MKKSFINNHCIYYYILFFALFFFIACSLSEKEQIHSITSKEDRPDISIENLYTYHTREGKINALVTSPLLNQYNNGNFAYFEFPKGVKVVLYDDKMKEKSMMSAKYAVYYQEKGVWEARDSVVIQNDKGTKLETDQLFGIEKSQKLYSTILVTITDANNTVISGKEGFESNFSFTAYKFHNVSGIIPLTDDLKTLNNNNYEK